jgi:hypothetical protein
MKRKPFLGLRSLFPLELEEAETPEQLKKAETWEQYGKRIEELAGSVADAVEAYHREIGLLTQYARDSSYRVKLNDFVNGRLSFAALPPDLREDLMGRLRCAFVPIQEEQARDNGQPWTVYRAVGDQIEAMHVVIEAYKGGSEAYPVAQMPPRLEVKDGANISAEDEAGLRVRAREFLAHPLYAGLRCRPQEAAMANLVRNLAVIWRGAVGISSKWSRLAAMESTKDPKPKRGRPEDIEAEHRRVFVLGVIRGYDIPAPSARLLREALPPLSPKMPTTTVRQRPGERSMKWRVGGTLLRPKWFCLDCRSTPRIIVKGKRNQARWFVKCRCGTFDIDKDEEIKGVWQEWVDGIKNP